MSFGCERVLGFEEELGMGRERSRCGDETMAASLVPVRLIGGGGAGVIEIAMPGGVVVRVDRDVDLKVLDRVLAALR